MIITKLRRTIKSGAVSFWRNGSVSLASVLILTVTLTVMASIFFSGVVLSSTLNTIKSKVDVNIYFADGTDEKSIYEVQNLIKQNADVATVDYISREKALEVFKQRHQDEDATLQALSEIGDNPLPASLNVKAKDPSKYDAIVTYINQVARNNDKEKIISKINYTKNKEAIDSLSRIINASNRMGTMIGIFFILVSILITFNTVRLAIYIFREEIAVMRLVGASEAYIKGPFVTVGILYGLVSGMLSVIVLLPMTQAIGVWTEKLGTGINLFSYYQDNIVMIIICATVSGAILGAISSFLAIRKYLKI